MNAAGVSINVNNLTDQDLDWLADVLLDRIDEEVGDGGADVGILVIPELDGFLTAIVSGPVAVLPSHWLPAIWGDFEPFWDTQEDAQAFISHLMTLHNEIATTLLDAPLAFDPIFFEGNSGDRRVVVVDDWCEGYMRGVRLTERDWRRGGKDIDELLEPIRAFTEEANWPAHELDDDAELIRLKDSIAPSARAIHAKWLAERSEESLQYRHRGPRIGRNDLCPCGSGKKYKRCCLN